MWSMCKEILFVGVDIISVRSLYELSIVTGLPPEFWFIFLINQI